MYEFINLVWGVVFVYRRYVEVHEPFSGEKLSGRQVVSESES